MKNIRKFRILSLFIFLTLVMACGGSNVVTPPNYQLAAPAGVAAQAGDSIIDLSWQAMDGVRFRVHYGTASGIYSGEDAVEGISPITTASNSFRLTGLENGRTYYMAVTAFDPSGEKKESSFSTEISAIPDMNGTEQPVLSATLDSNPLLFDCVENQGIIVKNFIIENKGGGLLSYVSEISPASSWLSLTPDHDSLGKNGFRQAGIGVNCSSLTAGNVYTGSVVIRANGVSGSPINIGISVTVTQPPQDQPILVVEAQNTMTFGDCFAGRDLLEKDITIKNTGGGSMNFTASVHEGASWLSISSTSGSIAGGGQLAAKVRADCRNLTPPTTITDLTGHIDISAVGATGSPYTLNASAVLKKPATLVHNILTLAEYSCTAGKDEVITKTFGIANQGHAPFTYSTSLNPALAWITMDPSTLTLPGGEMTFFRIRANCATVSQGTYNTTLTITASGAVGSPANANIRVVASAAPTPPSIKLPSSLEMICYQDTPNKQMDLTVENAGGLPLTWSATAGYAAWLTLAPTSGTVAASSNANIVASVNCAAMAPSSYFSTNVAITSNDAVHPSVTVPVNLSVVIRTPVKPVIGNPVAGYNEANVTWTASDRSESYEVCYDTVTHAAEPRSYPAANCLTAANLSLAIRNLTNATRYYLAVRGKNQFGVGPFSDEKSVLPSVNTLSTYRINANVDGTIYANCTNYNPDQSCATWTQASINTNMDLEVGGTPMARAYLRFTLNSPLPTDRTKIVDGMFRIYYSGRDGSGTVYPNINLYSIADFATLDFADWSMQANLLSSVAMSSNYNTWKEVVSLTTALFQGASASFMVTGGSSTMQYAFSQSGGADGPELIIHYKGYTW
jgi:hypothetical protein